MKTPRDILLARHAAADRELERIGNSVVRERFQEEQRRSILRPTWLEWLWPSPVAWACVAAVWLVILGFQLAAGDPPPLSQLAAAPRTPDTVAALREQHRLFVELVSPPPRDNVPPRPRSEAIAIARFEMV